MLHKKFRAIRAILMLHKGYTKFIMPAGIMSSASINIIRSNPIISADLSGLSVIRSFIIRMNPVYDKTDGGLNGFHRSTSLGQAIYSHREDFSLNTRKKENRKRNIGRDDNRRNKSKERVQESKNNR